MKRRHADRQFRIGDDDRRQQLRMEDDLLGVGRLVGDDAGAADFRAGAGRRRHGDDRRDRVGIGARPPVADILEVPDRARLAGLEGDQLAEIERRAAAEGDDAVMLALLEHGDAGGEVGIDRVRPSPRKTRHAGILASSRIFSVEATTGSLARPGSVTKSGRLMPAAASASGSSLMRPGAEADGGRVVPFGDQLGHC